MLLLLLSCFSRVQLWAHRRQPTRLPCPWDFPGNNTGVGCHFLLQCMKVKSENEITQSCPTLCDPMDCSLPGSSVHGIFQARVLEWGVIAFSVSPIYSSLKSYRKMYFTKIEEWTKKMKSVSLELGARTQNMRWAERTSQVMEKRSPKKP